MTPNSTFTERRIPGLDGLRAISLLLVLEAHWAPSLAFLAIANWGRAGLLIFFVLSGFLITDILAELHERVRVASVTPGVAIWNFYLRRFFRIQPVYYVGLAFVLIAGFSSAVRQDAIYHIFFVNNWSNILRWNDIGVYGPAAPW